ncbi:peptidoglycan-binding domain-containing protein [Sphingobacterium bambusae]|uniref:Peptidoglycan-binding domain-containing protein n=1 Tax=Sphingobacterium bambusae TaxID=662858 RepID=A0ABW6BKN1_9SPHI|nr:peptidoglycan-binding domain-containing protein [Sphingobacterium bambusae]WPL49360.1 peptidoglycan-binding domain-containing protein [Sphingobacterium bambusae]
MKDKLSTILKKLFLSSMAGIAANQPANAANVAETISSNPKEKELSFDKEADLSPKLLLKVNSGGDWSVVSHRSHRSHSSHRSHYSSSTSSSSSSRSTSSRSTGSSSGSSSSSSSKPLNFNSSGSSGSSGSAASNTVRPSTSISSGITATALKLGDRNLKKGMIGSDVTELINILLKKGYLKLENGEKQVTGTYTYDETIEATIKRFQKDNNITVDGNCGSTTVYYLLYL